MISRRRFIKHSTLAFGSLYLPVNTFQFKNNYFFRNNRPLVISTWDNRKANAAAWKVLSTGGRALDAIEAGIHIPESDPNDTSVGYGGLPDRDGFVTLDACIMDEFGNTGAVACLEEIMHPISVARRVMEKTPHVMLVGEGAQKFAISEGFIRENLLTKQAKEAWENWKIKSNYSPVINSERHDTIGMVALDSMGKISGGCSTSGMAYKMHGRIGDSPIIGAGLYTDNAVGGAAATGLGELVIKELTTFLTVELMRGGASPMKAASQAVRRIAEKHPEEARKNQVGIIAVDRRGRTGAFSLQPGFNYAVYQGDENKVFEAESLWP